MKDCVERLTETESEEKLGDVTPITDQNRLNSDIDLQGSSGKPLI